MRKRDRLVVLWLPWAGLVGAGLAWVLAHQIGSTTVNDDCQIGGPLFVGAVGLAALVVAVFSGLSSWRIWKRDHGTHVRRFLGLLGALFALLLSLGIVLQTSASFILPGCYT